MDEKEFSTKDATSYKRALRQLFTAISKLDIPRKKKAFLIVRSLYNIGFTSHGMARYGSEARFCNSTSQIQLLIEHYHPDDTEFAGILGRVSVSNLGYPRSWNIAIYENRLIDHIEKYGLGDRPTSDVQPKEKKVKVGKLEFETTTKEGPVKKTDSLFINSVIVAFMVGCVVGATVMKLTYQ